MARKRFPAARAKKKEKASASPRVGRPLAHKTPAGAHPRLIHGFLVGPVMKPGSGIAAAKTPSAAVSAGMRPRRPFPADTKYEGPADDSTFH